MAENRDKQQPPDTLAQTRVEAIRRLMKQARQAKSDQENAIPIRDEIVQDLIERLEQSSDPMPESTEIVDELARRLPEGVPLASDEQVEIHSEEVQEIMGFIPNWIIRWGITLIAALFFILLIGSWFVKYPDVVAANIVVTSTNPPVVLRARASGRLEHLLVVDKQSVEKGQYLAVLETTSDYRRIRKAKEQVEALQDGFADTTVGILSYLRLKPDPLLGELQSAYEALVNSLQEYGLFLNLKYHASKLALLRAQLQERERYRDQLTQQTQILQGEFTLSQKQHERTTELYHDGLVSQTDLENSQKTLLQKEYSLAGAKLGITNAGLQIAQTEQSLLDLQHDSLQTENRLQIDLKQACDRLLSQILGWEQKNALVSPMDGVVSLARYWNENQNVNAGDNVMAVLPNTPARIIGRVELPIQGSGKVRAGQAVNVKLTAYPYIEYGVVQGIVRSVSLVPDADRYVLTVSFPQGMTTSYGIDLAFAHEMGGTAEIITEDLRLLERIFNRARSHLTTTNR